MLVFLSLSFGEQKHLQSLSTVVNGWKLVPCAVLELFDNRNFPSTGKVRFLMVVQCNT